MERSLVPDKTHPDWGTYFWDDLDDFDCDYEGSYSKLFAMAEKVDKPTLRSRLKGQDQNSSQCDSFSDSSEERALLAKPGMEVDSVIYNPSKSVKPSSTVSNKDLYA